MIIGLYEGSKSWAKAEAQGFIYTAAEAAKKADIIMILINDEKQAALYKKRYRTEPRGRQHADVCSRLQYSFWMHRSAEER